MIQSYNTLVNTLTQFANNHLTLQRFKCSFFEQMPNFSTEDNNFPILYAIPSDVSMGENIDEFSFRIYCVDILQKDRSNEGTILNETLLVLRDLNNWLRLETSHDLNILNNPRAIPVNNFLTEFTTGWYMDVVIEATPETSDCAIPFSDNFIFTGVTVDCTQVTPYLTCDTLAACQSFIALEDRVTVLENKTIYDGTIFSGGTFYGDGSQLTGINVNDGYWTGGTGTNSIRSINQSHTASGNNSFIGGGYHNTITSDNAAIAGGKYNTVSGVRSFVGGGYNNLVSSGYHSAIVGGTNNSVNGSYSTVVGGCIGTVVGDYSSIISSKHRNGYGNSVVGNNSSLISTQGGGVTGYSSCVIAGGYSTLSSNYTTNVIGNNSIIAGGLNNSISSNSSSIIAGSSNTASGDNSFIGGGQNNIVSGNYSAIIGGDNNTTSGSSSAIIGGTNNTTSGARSAVIGGVSNIASGTRSVVIGGLGNIGTSNDTVYVPYLNIGSLSATTTATTYNDVVIASDGSVMTNKLYFIGVNFEVTGVTWNYVAPQQFKIFSIDNPSVITYSLLHNGTAYTLNNTIQLYDDLQISGVTTTGFLKLNAQKI